MATDANRIVIRHLKLGNHLPRLDVGGRATSAFNAEQVNGGNQKPSER